MKRPVYIILLIVIGIIFVYFEIYSSKEFDWTPNFEKSNKEPYGDYVLFDFLKDVFQDIEVNELDFYRFYSDKYDSITYTNYIIVASEPEIPDIDLKKMLDFVKKGNNIFIAAKRIPQHLSDTLKLSFDASLSISQKALLKFSNPRLNKEYTQKTWSGIYISSFDTTNSIVLSTANDEINFLKIKFGKGAFFINTCPLAFTNYFTLKNPEYALTALSYLDTQKNTVWDEYYKPLRKWKKSPIHLILTHKSLYYAYITSIVLVAIYMLFGSKRLQRIIPEYFKPRNTSLDFLKTVSSMYFNSKNHKNTALLRLNFWYDFLKQNYNIDTQGADIQDIADKTDCDKTTIRRIIETGELIKKQNQIDLELLQNFNNYLESFYKQINSKNYE